MLKHKTLFLPRWSLLPAILISFAFANSAHAVLPDLAPTGIRTDGYNVYVKVKYQYAFLGLNARFLIKVTNPRSGDVVVSPPISLSSVPNLVEYNLGPIANFGIAQCGQPGTRDLHVDVDSSNTVAESNENNNSLDVNLACAQCTPPLVPVYPTDSSCGCADPKQALNPNNNLCQDRPFACACPPGYWYTDTINYCLKAGSAMPSTAPFTSTPVRTPIAPGEQSNAYLRAGVGSIGEVSNVPNLPVEMYENPLDPNSVRVLCATVDVFTPPTGPAYCRNPLPTTNFSTSYWQTRFQGSAAIQVATPEVDNRWFSKAMCLDVQSPKDYVFQAGANTAYAIVVNGVFVAHCVNVFGVPNCSDKASFYLKHFAPGRYTVEFQSYGSSYQTAPKGSWFEMYDMSSSQISDASSSTSPNVVLSSQNWASTGSSWDYSDTNSTDPALTSLWKGNICPAGYFYDACAAVPTCVNTYDNLVSCTRW